MKTVLVNGVPYLVVGWSPTSGRLRVVPLRENPGNQISRGEAGYIDPPGQQIHCATCAFFCSGGRCEVVSGHIEGDGCCNLWSADRTYRATWLSGPEMARRISAK